MNDFNTQYRSGVVGSGNMDMAVDQGLRSFMLGVYNKMGLGLVLSGLLAYAASYVPAVRDLLFVTQNGQLTGLTGLGMLVQFAPLGIMLISMFTMRNPSKTGASLFYWTIVTLMGLGFGVLGLVYTGSSIASTFFATAAAFGGLSLYGYTTKKDLTGFGTFLIMALLGLILVSLVNMFLHNSMLNMLISGAGVLIFAGLTAYDTQKLKHTYYALGGNETALSVATSFGALNLYLDFVNLFMYLLRFMGDRR